MSMAMRVLATVWCLACVAPLAAQCPREWVATPNGVSDSEPPAFAAVNAMASWDPDAGGPTAPRLVVAGSFNVASDTIVSNVAWWDGSRWHALGSGLQGTVYALAVFNNSLYAGGDITSSGVTTISNLARWNGSSWENVGGGVNGRVRTLVTLPNSLFVGGEFIAAGGSPAHYAASWNGASWSAYSPAPQSPVVAAASLGGQPVIMSKSNLAGTGANSFNLAVWQSSNVWRQLGRFGLEDDSPSITADAGAVYFSAYVPSSQIPGLPSICMGGPSEPALIRMPPDGDWDVVMPYAWARAFTTHGGRLTALCQMASMCWAAPITRGPTIAAVYDGAWLAEPWKPDVTNGVLLSNNGRLYLGGRFSLVNGRHASCVAQLVNGEWLPVGPSFDAPARASTIINTAPYAAGDFTTFGNTALRGPAYFNTQTWQPFALTNGRVTAMRFYGPSPVAAGGLTVAGSFSTIGNVSAANIARYDPIAGTFVTFGSGLNGPAYAMTTATVSVSRQDLIVGGAFTTAGGGSANRIARWTSAGWISYPTGGGANNGMNGPVRALATFGGSLYAAGEFTTAGGASRPYIARWDGSAWQSVGAGMNATVRALQVFGGVLVAAGDFTLAGGTPVQYLAAWNGTQWAPFAGGLDAPAHALAVSGTSLIVGGEFNSADSVPISRVGEWNGTQWIPIGVNQLAPAGGVNGTVYTISVNSTGDIVVGGEFSRAGGQVSAFVARAVQPGTLTILNQPEPAASCPGDAASFATSANAGSAGAVVAYQWYRNGLPIADGPSAAGTLFAETTGPVLYLANTAPEDAGTFHCRITTSCGESVLTNAVALTVGGPQCTACGPADFNADGDLGTDADIEDFFACLAGSCCPACFGADFNSDGDVGTDADIEAFFRVLAGGPC